MTQAQPEHLEIIQKYKDEVAFLKEQLKNKEHELS